MNRSVGIFEKRAIEVEGIGQVFLADGVGVGPDAMDEAHHEEGREQGRPAAGEERQGDADDREHSEVHTDVFEDLRHEHTAHAHADEAAVVGISGGSGDHEDAHDEEDIEQDHERAAEESELFADGSEDEVGMRSGQDFVISPAEETFSEESAGGDGLFTEQCLPAVDDRVERGIKPDDDPALLIEGEVIPDIGRRQHDRACDAGEVAEVETRAEEHHGDDREIDERDAEVARK